jgi:DNA-binding MarR family transcriptional regulator
MSKPGLNVLPIFHMLTAAQAHAKTAFESATGMSFIRFALLERIEAEPGDQITEHVRRLHWSLHNHSYNFSELEKAGLIVRWPGLQSRAGHIPDRRAVHYELTREGEEALRAARAKAEAVAINLFAAPHLRSIKAFLNSGEWAEI